MPIKLTGPINFPDIRDEFGPAGSGAMSLDDYRRGGDLVPNKNINSNIPLAGTSLPISLEDFYGASKIITLSYTGYGGGGAGGSGFENNSDIISRAGYGGFSGILTKATFDAEKQSNNGVNPLGLNASSFMSAFDVTKDGSLNHGINGSLLSNRAAAENGVGGLNNFDSTANANAGQASVFGPGGAGGARNSTGSSAPWGNWAAGGGGGGGDQGNGDNYEFFGLINRGGSDEWGKSGQGGEDGRGKWQGKVDLDVEVDYVVCCGHGGKPAFAVGQHDGGYGNPGVFEFTVDSDTGTFAFEPIAVGPVFDNRNKSHYYGFRIQRSGRVTLFDV